MKNKNGEHVCVEYHLVRKDFTKERIFYLPDISFYITRSSLSKKSKKNIIHDCVSGLLSKLTHV